VGVADSAVRLSEPASATVVVEITPAPVEREVAGVPVRWRNLGTGLASPRISPEVAKVTVRGGREAMAALKADGIDAFVDLTGLGPGRYTLKVQVDPSQEFSIGSVTPPLVTVIIK
jgi:YbbR domain-containing protein